MLPGYEHHHFKSLAARGRPTLLLCMSLLLLEVALTRARWGLMGPGFVWQLLDPRRDGSHC